MNKTSSVVLGTALIVVFTILMIGSTYNKKTIEQVSVDNVNNVEVRDGIQYVTIIARGGYSPRFSNAKAGVPTKLVVKTDGTFDCSSSLLIRSLGIQKILPKTGSTEIDLGIPKENTPIVGMCSMGMYNFNIDFK